MWLTTEEYADKLGISKATVYRWIKSDTLPHSYQKLGPRSIRINLPDDYKDKQLPKPSKVSGSKTIAYCRVSTNSQKDGLKEQKLVILEYANKNGITIDEIVEEISSGFNGNRRKLQHILTRVLCLPSSPPALVHEGNCSAALSVPGYDPRS